MQSSPSQPTSKQTTPNASTSLIHTVPKDHSGWGTEEEMDQYSHSALCRYHQRNMERMSKLEVSPEKMTISADTPLQVSMKCVAAVKQEVLVELDSFLFVILDPRAARGTKSQIYCVMGPGETLKFQIGMIKETPPGVHESDLPFMEKPEGKLSFYHTTSGKLDDSDASWAFNKDAKSGLVPGPPSLLQPPSHHFKRDMFLEEETNVTKKRRDQFEWILKKEAMRKERERQRSAEECKKKRRKEKCCGCSIL